MRYPKKFKRWYQKYAVQNDLDGECLSIHLNEAVRRIAYRAWRQGRRVERENIDRVESGQGQTHNPIET